MRDLSWVGFWLCFISWFKCVVRKVLTCLQSQREEGDCSRVRYTCRLKQRDLYSFRMCWFVPVFDVFNSFYCFSLLLVYLFICAVIIPYSLFLIPSTSAFPITFLISSSLLPQISPMTASYTLISPSLTFIYCCNRTYLSSCLNSSMVSINYCTCPWYPSLTSPRYRLNDLITERMIQFQYKATQVGFRLSVLLLEDT